MIEIRKYLDSQDRSPFAAWFMGLNARAAAKIAVHLKRMEMGNLSNVDPVGEERAGEEDRGDRAIGFTSDATAMPS